MNPFQTQYPLSPRKFWKKFLPTVIPTLIFGMLAGPMVVVVPSPLYASEAGLSLGALILLSIVAAMVVAGLMFWWNAWYFGAYIRSYYYDGGQDFITIRKRVFTPQEIHVQYQKIQDVYVDQDLLDRIMGLYDVHIASATVSSAIEAHIDGVDAQVAEGLKMFFLGKISGASVAPAMAQNAGDAAAPAAPGAPVQFSQEISSTVYPLQSIWLVKSILGSVISSLIMVGTVMLWFFFGSHKDGQLLSFDPHIILWICFALFIISFVFQVITTLIWKSNYAFAFLPDYIQFNTGIFSRSETHLPYKSVQDVNLSQDILDRMFGIASVTIENAVQSVGTQNPGLRLVGLKLADARAITEQVKATVLSKNSSQMGL